MTSNALFSSTPMPGEINHGELDPNSPEGQAKTERSQEEVDQTNADLLASLYGVSAPEKAQDLGLSQEELEQPINETDEGMDPHSPEKPEAESLENEQSLDRPREYFEQEDNDPEAPHSREHNLDNAVVRDIYEGIVKGRDLQNIYEGLVKRYAPNGQERVLEALDGDFKLNNEEANTADVMRFNSGEDRKDESQAEIRHDATQLALNEAIEGIKALAIADLAMRESLHSRSEEEAVDALHQRQQEITESESKATNAASQLERTRSFLGENRNPVTQDQFSDIIGETQQAIENSKQTLQMAEDLRKRPEELQESADDTHETTDNSEYGESL